MRMSKKKKKTKSDLFLPEMEAWSKNGCSQYLFAYKRHVPYFILYFARFLKISSGTDQNYPKLNIKAKNRVDHTQFWVKNVTFPTFFFVVHVL